MGPAFRMVGALFGTREAGVGQAQQRSVRLLDQIDLDQARSRRHHLAAFIAEAVDQAVHRHDLAERAARNASAGDIDEIEPAGLRLDLRLGSHPAQDLLRIGQKCEHHGGRRRDVLLAADDEGLLHQSPPWLRIQRLSYASWWRNQYPVSLRPFGARSSHWYMPQRPSNPRAYVE